MAPSLGPRVQSSVSKPCWRANGQARKRQSSQGGNASGPGPSRCPARGSQSSCGFPESGWQKGRAETPKAAHSARAGRGASAVLSQRSGRAGEGGFRPGEKEALLDATPGCLISGAERATSGVVYSTSRSSSAIGAGTDPRGPFGQIQQSSRQARASKGWQRTGGAAGMWFQLAPCGGVEIASASRAVILQASADPKRVGSLIFIWLPGQRFHGKNSSLWRGGRL